MNDQQPTSGAPLPAPAPNVPAPPAPIVVRGVLPRKAGELPGMSVEAASEARAAVPGQYVPRAAVATAHPRRVKNGIKLLTRGAGTPGATISAWSSQRWMRLVEDLAAPGAIAEGQAYAKSGQTRTLSVQAGRISAQVQGRMPYAYGVEVALPVLTSEQWHKVLGAMLDEARHLAGLLAGDVPPNIEDLFSPLRLRLFPQEQHDLTATCTCGQCGPGGTAGAGWCKHVCCVMILLAERLGADTFLMFALRGMAREQLLDELRMRRAAGQTAGRAGDVAGSGAGAPGTGLALPAYMPRLPGLSEVSLPALDQCLDDFWSAPAGGAHLDLTMEAPAVSHPLLRRLGPSPFDAAAGAKFPLVGLLATCYDVISEHTLRAARGEGAPPDQAQD